MTIGDVNGYGYRFTMTIGDVNGVSLLVMLSERLIFCDVNG
jgi:hypothetical protein